MREKKAFLLILLSILTFSFLGRTALVESDPYLSTMIQVLELHRAVDFLSSSPFPGLANGNLTPQGEQQRRNLSKIADILRPNLTVIWQLMNQGQIDDAQVLMQKLEVPVKEIHTKKLSRSFISLELHYLESILLGKPDQPPLVISARRNFRHTLDRLRAYPLPTTKNIAFIYSAKGWEELIAMWMQSDLNYFGFKVTIVDGNNQNIAGLLQEAEPLHHVITLTNNELNEKRELLDSLTVYFAKHHELLRTNISFSTQTSLAIKSPEKDISPWTYNFRMLDLLENLLNVKFLKKKIFEVHQQNATIDELRALFPLKPHTHIDSKSALIEELASDNQQLRLQIMRLEDQLLCVICCERPFNHLFLPCAHLIACEICADEVASCPMCKGQIIERKLVFPP